MKLLFILIFGILPGLLAAWQPTVEADSEEQLAKVSDIENMIVRYHRDEFSAWPANNGIWSWKNGNEIFVGFTFGKYNNNSQGHRISGPKNTLARSMNGGKTWETFTPENFADESLEASLLMKRSLSYIILRLKNFLSNITFAPYFLLIFLNIKL